MQAAVDLPMQPMLLTASTESSSAPQRQTSAKDLFIATAAAAVTTSQVNSDIPTCTTTSSAHQPPVRAATLRCGAAPPVAPLQQYPAATPQDLHFAQAPTPAAVPATSPAATQSAPDPTPAPAAAIVQAPAPTTREVDTFDISRTRAALLPPPAGNATVDEKMDFLHQQLDGIGTEMIILNGLVLLGHGDNERLQGGTQLYA